MLVILVLITILPIWIFGLPILFKHVIEYFKYRAETPKIISILYFCFVIGIFWDNYRVFTILSYGYVNRDFDVLFYNLKFFSYFVGIFFITHLMFRFTAQVEKASKYDLVIQGFYFFSIPVLSIINVYTFRETPPDEIGFYDFQTDPLLMLVCVLMYAPLIAYIIFKLRMISGEIRSEKTSKLLFLSIIAIVSMIVERGGTLVYYFIVGSPGWLIFVDPLILDFYVVPMFILIFKNPEFVENMSIYFAYKSVYLIKPDGTIIFGYNIRKNNFINIFDSQRVLFGAFLTAVTKSLPKLENNHAVETIQMGSDILLVSQSRILMGILYCTENTPLMRIKLSTFITMFEAQFEEDLEKKVISRDRFMYDGNVLLLLNSIFR